MVEKSELTQYDYINSLVYFGAHSWCAPCKELKPRLDNLSKDYDNINFIYVDFDKSQDLFEKHGIKSLPTVKIFINGEEKHSLYGALKTEDYRSKLNLYS